MKIIQKQTFLKDIWNSKEIDLGDTLKIVVDVKKHLVGIDAEMHADIEQEMLESGSEQADLWGANIVLQDDSYRIEFTSFINIRPAQNNRSMEVQDEKLREQISRIITELIK